MQMSRLHEVALDALGPPPPLPPIPRVDESEPQIEVIWEADDADDLAVTGRFVRFSMPYEKLEIEDVPALAAVTRARSTTYVRTVPNARPTTRMPAVVPPSATVPFDRVWFEADGDAEDLQIQPPMWRRLARSWTWLFVSLAVGGAAVAYMASL